MGSHIRTYVLQPYTQVKDHRTGEETTDARAVLDGELDAFMLAALAWNNHDDRRQRARGSLYAAKLD